MLHVRLANFLFALPWYLARILPPSAARRSLLPGHPSGRRSQHPRPPGQAPSPQRRVLAILHIFSGESCPRVVLPRVRRCGSCDVGDKSFACSRTPSMQFIKGEILHAWREHLRSTRAFTCNNVSATSSGLQDESCLARLRVTSRLSHYRQACFFFKALL